MSVPIEDAPDVAASRRRQSVDSTLASLRLEGIELPLDARADMEAFVRGQLTDDQLWERTLAKIRSRAAELGR